MLRAALNLLVYVLAATALGAGCNTVHTARPIGEGNHQVLLSVGGPIAGVGEPSLLVPLTVITYKYGLTDRLDVYGGWHVLETFVNNGNLFVDVGASYYLLDQRELFPGVSIAAQASPLVNFESAWAYFDLQVTASWALDPQFERHLIYTGLHNGLTPFNAGAVDVPVYTWAPFVGYQARLFDDALGVNAEVKWIRPYQSTDAAVIGYFGPGDLGALAFFVGLSGHFGAREINKMGVKR